MAAPGRIRQRLALAIVLTALIPVLVAIWLAETTVRQTAARFYQPDIGLHLDRSLGLYQELARSVKALMREQAAAIAAREPLRRAAQSGDRAALTQELARAAADHQNLVRLAVKAADGSELAHVERDRPLDPARENQLEVVRPLGDPDDDEAPMLVGVFAADKKRFDELGEMSQFVDTYKQIEKRRGADEQSYVLAFTLLLGITIVAAVGVGALLARGVSDRIGQLAQATKLVAAGDLGIRVRDTGHDEISDLARAFNRMLSEVAESRGRVEYLQRIAAWQEMARRLAHEIKNPLTPIQLAVQEIHRRYDGADPTFRKLLDSTLEIVEDEVGTLRRLVGEFSDFARLPHAKLVREDLAGFLHEQSERLSVTDEERGDGAEPDDIASLRREHGMALEFELPEGPELVLMDRQMLRRVLLNLVQNAAQALRGTDRPARVRVRLARDGDFYNLDVEDSGPGIPAGLRETVFDPYVTTKRDGTGLGLSIVKKIVMEHGGSVSADDSTLGGARLRVRVPAAGTPAAALAGLVQERRAEREAGSGIEA